MNFLDKDRLRMETSKQRLFIRVKAGFYNLLSDKKKQKIFGMFCIAIICMWLCKKLIWYTPMLPVVGNVLGTFFALSITLGGIMVLLILFGKPFESLEINKRLLEAGFVNAIGEPPIFEYKLKCQEDGNKFILLFWSKGIPLHMWNEKIELIENALNIIISEIKLGEDMQTVEVYAVDGDFEFPERIIWKDEIIAAAESELVVGVSPVENIVISLNTYPHLLIGGSTGSGKSVLLKVLLRQCVKKDYKVIVADFKGGVDFQGFWRYHVTLITEKEVVKNQLEKIVEEIEYRKSTFLKYQCANLSEYYKKGYTNFQRIVFACDEISEMLDKAGLCKEEKKEVEEIERSISTIARMGRAFGIHLILATQRPDANVLNGQIKNNIDYRICGRADNVLSQIILDNTDAATRISKSDRGMFVNQNGTLFKSYILLDEQEL